MGECWLYRRSGLLNALLLRSLLYLTSFHLTLLDIVNEDDLFLWEAMIQGPEGTPYEGGVFPAELKFPKDYPLMPPTMKFQCDIWHTNGKMLVFLKYEG